MKKSTIALGLVAIAAAGVLTGLLIAPQKGRKLRKKIKNKTTGFVQDAMELFNRAKNTAEDVEEQSAAI